MSAQPSYADVVQQKKRCKYWPACRKGEACEFVHPTEPCEFETTDACPYGQYCRYVHTGEQGYETMARGKRIRCRDWPNCERGESCWFVHPTARCRNRTVEACPAGESCIFLHESDPGYADAGSDGGHVADLSLIDSLLAEYNALVMEPIAAAASSDDDESDPGSDPAPAVVVDEPPPANAATSSLTVDEGGGGESASGSGYDDVSDAGSEYSSSGYGGRLRIVSYNVAWMNDLFSRVADSNGRYTFLPYNIHRGLPDVHQWCCTLAAELRVTDADAVCILEGPDHIAKMALFVNTYLAGMFTVHGGQDGYEQRIYWLVSNNSPVVAASHLVSDAPTADLSSKFFVDINADMDLEEYRFVRIPVVVDLHLAADLVPGPPPDAPVTVRLIGVHLKSKKVNDGREKWDGGPEERARVVKTAVINRRKMLAEAFRLRSYLDTVMSDATLGVDDVIVAGDFNDGPGMDTFQSQFLTAAVADVIIGSTFHPTRLLAHAFLHMLPPADAYTIIHNDYIDNVVDRRLLLDHILLSPSLACYSISGGVFHHLHSFFATPKPLVNEPLFETSTSRPLVNRALSDHRPVWVDLDATAVAAAAIRRRAAPDADLVPRSIFIDTGAGLSARLAPRPPSSASSRSTHSGDAWEWRVLHHSGGGRRRRGRRNNDDDNDDYDDRGADRRRRGGQRSGRRRYGGSRGHGRDRNRDRDRDRDREGGRGGGDRGKRRYGRRNASRAQRRRMRSAGDRDD